MGKDILVNRVPPTGARVELIKPLHGYEAGAGGVVASNRLDGSQRILVRFDKTGHSVPVEPEALRLAATHGR
jgi:hypothetical protein